jgi:hypothetical protein
MKRPLLSVALRCVSFVGFYMVREILVYLFAKIFVLMLPISSAVLVLAVDMEEALISLGKIGIGDLVAHTSLVNCKHEICERLSCPVRCATPGLPFLKFHLATYDFNDRFTQQRSCHSFCIDLRDYSDAERTGFLILRKHFVHGLILKKRYLMLVAQDPHIGKKL